MKGPDFGINSEEIDEDEREIRVVLTAPHKGQFLLDHTYLCPLEPKSNLPVSLVLSTLEKDCTDKA